MIYLLLAVSWLLFYAAIGHLSRQVKSLDRQCALHLRALKENDRSISRLSGENARLYGQVYDPDPKHNQGTNTPEPLWKRLADVERLASSHESACELNSAGLEAQTTLSILHAETVTRLQSRVDKLAHDPHYQKPVRKDN